MRLVLSLAFLACLFLKDGNAVDTIRINSLDVDIGSDGTDDDVTIEICSTKGNEFGYDCCKTKELNSGWTNDWNRWDNEVWGPEWLGKCKTYLFRPQRSLNVRLIKTGTDDLVVSQLKIKTSKGDFLCGNINMKNNIKSASKSCRTNALKWWNEEEEYTRVGHRLKLKKKKKKKNKLAKKIAKAKVASKVAKKIAKTISKKSSSSRRSGSRRG